MRGEEGGGEGEGEGKREELGRGVGRDGRKGEGVYLSSICV